MRSLISKGATVAIIVMASGAAAGQPQGSPTPGVISAILIGPSPKQAPSRPITFNQDSVVDRILSFDANGDKRIARDELPERMQALVGRFDTDRDGFLCWDEILTLTTRERPVRQSQRFSARRPPGLADIVTDLKLPPATHDRAMAIVQEQIALRVIHSAAGAPVYAAMREVLDDEDYENFVAAVDRLRTTSRGFAGGVAGGVVRQR